MEERLERCILYKAIKSERKINNLQNHQKELLFENYMRQQFCGKVLNFQNMKTGIKEFRGVLLEIRQSSGYLNYSFFRFIAI